MNFVSKPAAVLFATDIAARGLDFPEVDWVVQVDAPEDSAMYIHRVGRTARYKRNGKALLLLLPNEEKPFLALLEKAKVPGLKRLSMNPNLKVSIAQKAAAINASKPEVTFTGTIINNFISRDRVICI
jgi:ATP-dependent RNA helicase DDX10/DBP4